ncbi:phosphodiester glycosidase family protein [Leptolyngbya sp. BC1307]|uniref:phosphodiester glycosidase family protein n=1 Tax=Leptolyngbya sp. BC1307 TaxID=2029589 RepID=UPI000EFBD257|nr:phosphodiester glycosidase family protein [Leptolyngbya sp. BC1307]
MKSLRHRPIRSRRSPGQRSSQQARRPKRLLLGRVISLSLLTSLGWAVVSSVGLRSAPAGWWLSGRSGDRPSQMASPSAGLSAGVMPGLGRLQPIESFQPVARADDTRAELSGNRIRLNGQALTGFWQQKNGRIGISSGSLTSLMGVELLSTTDPAQQPVRWFPTQSTPLLLPAWWDATNRYIDITNLVASAGWTAQAAGTTLDLTLPQSRVNGVRQGRQTWGDRVVVDLTGPATWQMEAADVYTVTIDGAITPQMVSAFRAMPGNLLTQLDVAALSGRTVIKIKTKDGASPQIWSTGNPSRVVIDIRQDAMVERDIAWAPGLRWRQQYITVGRDRFPVYMFVTRPNPATLALRPISAAPNSAIGIEPLLSMAQRQGVSGAVNAGFFNRNNQLPLGAVRSGGRWISGPILGRGAMAWNDQGDLVMDRLALSEVVTTASGQALPVLTLNSGYVRAGVGRYTSDWGATYTPIVDNEIVVTVRNDTVAAQQTLGKAGTGSVPIPTDGYLLTLRSNSSAAGSFAPGARLALASQSQPSVFDQYPNVIGGGPLLIRDRNIVLDPQLEGFSTNFIQGAAPRTAVGKTADGTWIVATMHDRVGGRGPTLAETAQIMQQLGAVDALNLDGGSSSSFYLGGQLLNRSPRTAARVNNGIGLFILGR